MAFALAVPAGALGLLSQASAADRFADRESLVGASFLVAGDSQNATADSGEPAHAGSAPAARSLWWQWTAAASGPVRIETTGSNFDTVLAVYTGSSLGSLVRVAQNDDAGVDVISCVTFHATAGEKYQIAVDDFTGAGGAVVLRGMQMASGLIYVSDFEQMAAGSDVLVGQQGWQGMFVDGAEGIESANGQNRAFITGAANTGSVSGLWLPLNVAGIAASSSRVLISTTCEVRRASGAEALSFFFLIYDADGAFQGGLEFDSLTTAIYRLDGVNRTATGRNFVPGQEDPLELMVTPATNTWTARLGGVLLFQNVQFSAVDTSAATMGSLVVASSRDEATSLTTTRMLFGDVFVAEVDSLPASGLGDSVRLRLPYFGTPSAVPGKVEAENFDEGGFGISYSDTTPENLGGAYRPGSVDIEEYNGSRHIGWFKSGEWLSYSVNAVHTGTYRMDVSVASYNQGGTFRVEVDGVDASGTMTVPNTAGWVAWKTISFETSLTKGEHEIRLVGTANSDANSGYVGNLNWFELTALSIEEPEPPVTEEPPVEPAPEPEPPVTEPPVVEPPVLETPEPEAPVEETPGTEPPTTEPPATEPPVTEPPATAARTPFLGSARQIPGWIDAEWYDNGGRDVAYSDTTPGNFGGTFRLDDVDIEEVDESRHIGWFEAGEWLLFTTRVQESATYLVEVRVASGGPGGLIRFEIDGVDASGSMTIPDTGGWVNWQVLTFEVALTEGTHDLKIVGLQNNAGNGGHIGNLDWLNFVKVSAPVETGTTTPEPNTPEPEEPPIESPEVGVISVPAPELTSQGVALAWAPAEGAAQYEVWRSTDGSFESATKVAVTSFTAWEDAELASTGSYTYWIRSFSSGGELIASGTITAEWQAPLSRLVNISARGRVLPGQPMIAGFVIEGSSTRRVLVRALGPSLSDFGVSEYIEQPTASVVSPQTGAMLADVRQGWAAAGNSSQVHEAMQSSGAFLLDSTARDVAFVMDLEPGRYTAEVGSAGGFGVGLVEVYALDQDEEVHAGRLLNISTRGHAGTGSDALIAGFVVSGTQPRRILIRGAGPALAGYGIDGYMDDPEIRIHSAADDSIVAGNNDWAGDTGLADAFTATGAFAFAAGSRDSAVLVDLEPGAYTALLVPANGEAGIALVEVYEVPAQ